MTCDEAGGDERDGGVESGDVTRGVRHTLQTIGLCPFCRQEVSQEGELTSGGIWTVPKQGGQPQLGVCLSISGGVLMRDTEETTLSVFGHWYFQYRPYKSCIKLCIHQWILCVFCPYSGYTQYTVTAEFLINR